MESLTMASAVERRAPRGTDETDAGRLTSVVPRARLRPGMSFGHDVLLALIMGFAMAATVFLYR